MWLKFREKKSTAWENWTSMKYSNNTGRTTWSSRRFSAGIFARKERKEQARRRASPVVKATAVQQNELLSFPKPNSEYSDDDLNLNPSFSLRHPVWDPYLGTYIHVH